MSLMEVMVVIIIISSIALLAIPRLTKSNYPTKKLFRTMYALTKGLKASAQIHNKTYRLNFDIKKNREGRSETFFWVDSQQGRFLLPSSSDTTESPGSTTDSSANEEDNENNASNKDSQWTLEGRFFKKKQKLSPNLVLKAIWTKGFKQPHEEGLFAIYFFANGESQTTILHFQEDEQKKWSFIIPRLSIKNNLRPGFVTLKDLKH